jgi:hypothetical protein
MRGFSAASVSRPLPPRDLRGPGHHPEAQAAAMARLAPADSNRRLFVSVSRRAALCCASVKFIALQSEIDYTVDDPTGAFPNPTLGASAPTAFSSLNGSGRSTQEFCPALLPFHR